MRQVITHPRDLRPWNPGFLTEEVVGKSLDCLSDLQKSDAHGVEDQAVGEIAPSQMRANRVDRRKDVAYAAGPENSQRHGLGFDTRAEIRLEVALRHDVHAHAQHALEIVDEPAEPEEPRSGC